MAVPPQNFQTETDRIVETYARRDQSIPEDRYSRFNPATLFMLQEVEKRILRSLQRLGCSPLRDKRILDVGCGSGDWLQSFLLWQAKPENLFGVDLLSNKIEEARRRLPSAVTLKVGNAIGIDFPDQSFDLVFQFTVCSSILDRAMRGQVAREMLRVLRPGGRVIWFDLLVNNPFNREVRGLGRVEVRQLFPQCRIDFQRVTYLAPVVRTLPALCPILSAVRIFSTHYLAFIAKGSEAAH